MLFFQCQAAFYNKKPEANCCPRSKKVHDQSCLSSILSYVSQNRAAKDACDLLHINETDLQRTAYESLQYLLFSPLCTMLSQKTVPLLSHAKEQLVIFQADDQASHTLHQNGKTAQSYLCLHALHDNSHSLLYIHAFLTVNPDHQYTHADSVSAFAFFINGVFIH